MAKIRAYIEDVSNELLHKVSWPTWEELQSSSVVVLIASVIIAMIIWVMDFAMGMRGLGDDSVFWKGVLGFFYSWF